MKESNAPKFCSSCGESLHPLPYLHVERKCNECEKAIFVREAGENRQGTTIPFSISLKPKANTHLHKPGVNWLVQQFFLDGAPKTHRDLNDLFDRYEDVAEKKLMRSEKLSSLNLNLDREADAETIYKILEKDKSAWEWWAYQTGIYSSIGRNSVRDGELEKAAYACFMAGKCHSMLVFVAELEDLVWKGYLAEKVVYNAAAAAAGSPAEVEAIERLHPLFEKLSNAVLYAWANSEDPIGPKIGFNDLSESIIKALAQFHMASRERKREEEKTNRAYTRTIHDMRIRWFGTGVAVLGGLIGAAKALGWL